MSRSTIFDNLRYYKSVHRRHEGVTSLEKVVQGEGNSPTRKTMEVATWFLSIVSDKYAHSRILRAYTSSRAQYLDPQLSSKLKDNMHVLFISIFSCTL